MNDQRGTVEAAAEQGTDATVAPPTGTGAGSGLTLTPLFDPGPSGKEGTMAPTEPTEEAPPASLVGSWSAFTLSDVLTLLADTVQTGELQVVNDVVDGKLWLEDGQFSNAHVGAASTLGQAVFELACVTDGWFYFTAGLTSSSGQPTVPVAAVMDEVRPQVDEWRELRQVVPLEAVVALSPTPPGQDVQIRGDQWNVLTTVGNAGHTVRAVVERIGGDQIAGLRTLRDLQSSGLIVLDAPSEDAPTSTPAGAFDPGGDEGAPVANLPSPPATGIPDDRVDGLAPPPPPGRDAAVSASNDRFGSLAEVAIMPPPIAGDPWAATAESNGSANGSATAGSGDHGAA
jgi:hypothetical protein